MPWRATASSTSRVSGSSAPSSSTTLTGSMCTPWLAQLLLQAHPHRRLGAGRDLVAARHLVERVDGRQPHGPRPLARGDLDRERVHAPDGAVQRHRAEHLDRRDDAADDAGALGRRRVVRLQLEARQPELLAAARQADVVDDPLDGVGRDVHVHVVGAAHELAAAGGGRQLIGRRHCDPLALELREPAAGRRRSRAAATPSSASSSRASRDLADAARRVARAARDQALEQRGVGARRAPPRSPRASSPRSRPRARRAGSPGTRPPAPS